ATDDADDSHREPERGAGALEDRALLDMHLEEAGGQLVPLDEGGAAHAAALLVAEDDDRPVAHPLDRLDAGDDPERSVELAPVRHRVEMRAGPDLAVAEAADQVPDAVGLDAEAGVLQPARGELVRLLLARAPAATVGPD